MVAQHGVVESSAIGQWSVALGELHRRMFETFASVYEPTVPPLLAGRRARSGEFALYRPLSTST